VEYREFRIQIRNRHETAVVRGTIPMNPSPPVPMDRLAERTINVLARYLAMGRMETREELVVLGTHLFAGLVDDRVRDELAKELDNVRKNPNTVLRLVLEFAEEARELAELPWEYLYFPDNVDDRGQGFFIAADPESRLILARHVPVLQDLEAADRPLRILVVVSQPEVIPEGEPELKGVQAEPIVNAIDRLAADSNGGIKFDVLRQPTKESLTARVGLFEPHVVHFLGHGRYVPNAGGSLAFVADDKKTLSWISDQDLPDCFAPQVEPGVRTTPPRLVFLHACEGAHSDSYEAFRGVALQLVYTRTPAVVAMQYQVENKVANLFALKFYESLGKGKRIDEAVQDGRRELGMYLKETNFSSRAFGSPVVFLQNAEGIIKVPQPEDGQIDGDTPPTAVRLRCPNCSREVRFEGQEYCNFCPATLSQFPRCKKCRQLLPLDARRCGDCGTPVESEPSRTEAGARPAKPAGAVSGYAAAQTKTLPGEGDTVTVVEEPDPEQFRRSSNGQ
jgi:hypothetical protein